MNAGDDELAAEARARVVINQQLKQAGWLVQKRKDLNLRAGQGVAVEEVHMKADHGRVDYLLYVDRKVVGVIEAKPMGTPLAGVQWQSAIVREDGGEDSRWRFFTYDELLSRDKVNLDITWLRDDSLDDLDNLPAPEVIAREIVEDLTAALAEFEAVASALEATSRPEVEGGTS